MVVELLHEEKTLRRIPIIVTKVRPFKWLWLVDMQYPSMHSIEGYYKGMWIITKYQ